MRCRVVGVIHFFIRIRFDGVIFYLAFVDWAKKQLEDFAEIFRKQVYTSDVDSTVMEDAMKITFTQSKKVW